MDGWKDIATKSGKIKLIIKLTLEKVNNFQRPLRYLTCPFEKIVGVSDFSATSSSFN